MKTLMPLKSYHGKTRPFAGRKDKEARNKAVLDAREVYIIESLLALWFTVCTGLDIWWQSTTSHY